MTPAPERRNSAGINLADRHELEPLMESVRDALSRQWRAMPLVAAPVTAWLNNHHIQLVGEAALRQYDGFVRAAAKTRVASGASAP